MGKVKKQRASKVNYAQAKRLISPKDSRLKEVSEKADAKAAKAKAAETRQVTQTPSAMFFKYNTALGPPYFVLVDTNFINFSIKVMSLKLAKLSSASYTLSARVPLTVACCMCFVWLLTEQARDDQGHDGLSASKSNAMHY